MHPSGNREELCNPNHDMEAAGKDYLPNAKGFRLTRKRCRDIGKVGSVRCVHPMPTGPRIVWPVLIAVDQ